MLKKRLHPIRVFVVHNIISNYSVEEGPKSDCMLVDDFRCSLIQLNKQYRFISLYDALRHLKTDKIRTKNYAVLTADDGYKSIFYQLPWLIDNHIPVTLFINPKYLDGNSFSQHLWDFVSANNPELTVEQFVKDRYITFADLQSIKSPFVTIASHGFEHTDNSQMTAEQFADYMQMTLSEIEQYHSCAPFHAYPWGKHSDITDSVLRDMHFCPLRADGWYNINDATQIHREYLPVV